MNILKVNESSAKEVILLRVDVELVPGKYYVCYCNNTFLTMQAISRRELIINSKLEDFKHPLEIYSA